METIVNENKYNNLTVEDMINFIKEQNQKIKSGEQPTLTGKNEYSNIRNLLKEEMIGLNDGTCDFLDVSFAEIDAWYSKITLPSYQEYSEDLGNIKHGDSNNIPAEFTQSEIFAAIIYNGVEKRDGIIVTERDNQYFLREFVLCGDNYLSRMNAKVLNKNSNDELVAKIKSVASKTKESPLNGYLMVLNDTDFEKINELHKNDKYATIRTLSELEKLRKKVIDINISEDSMKR